MQLHFPAVHVDTLVLILVATVTPVTLYPQLVVVNVLQVIAV